MAALTIITILIFLGIVRSRHWYLPYRGGTSDIPYIDIPANAPDARVQDILTTVCLTGCSIVVTQLNGTTLRVYHDHGDATGQIVNGQYQGRPVVYDLSWIEGVDYQVADLWREQALPWSLSFATETQHFHYEYLLVYTSQGWLRQTRLMRQIQGHEGINGATLVNHMTNVWPGDGLRQGSIEAVNKLLATYQVVVFECQRRTGETTSSESIKSTVSCQDGETLVSCMIDGWHNIQGTYIDPTDSGTCIAGTSGGYSVFAVANCCTFPDGAVDSVFTVVGNDSSTQSVAKCSSGTVTGCQIDYVSGSTNNLRGAYPGPTQDLIGYDIVNQSSTENKCTAEARSTSSIIRGGAQCIDTTSEYELDCVTSSTLMGGSSARFDGGCPANYTLVSCGSFTPTGNSLDDWHITDNGDCYIQQDNHIAHYSVSICCQLRYFAEIEATTPAPVTPVPSTPAPVAPTSTPALATYLGCYVDSSSRRFEWGYQTVANHDISVCVGLCIDGGYEYMGLQYDNECFCGNDLDYITSLGTRDASGGQCGMNQQDTDEYNNYGCWGTNSEPLPDATLNSFLLSLSAKKWFRLQKPN